MELLNLCVTMDYQLCITKYSRAVRLIIDMCISKQVTFRKLFQISQDNIYKNQGMRPRQKDNQQWINVSFKKNWKIFEMKKKIKEEKNEPFSSYHIALIFPIQKLQSQLTSNIQLFFSYLCYLMKYSTSKLANKNFRRTLRWCGIHFRRKTKIIELQSMASGMLKDVKD